MNRTRIFLFAGLGVLATTLSILAAKKFKKSKNPKWIDREDDFTGSPSYRSFGGATK
jgi:hypothetical protein